MTDPIVMLDHFPQLFEENTPIVIIKKDVVFSIPSDGNVVEGSWVLDA